MAEPHTAVPMQAHDEDVEYKPPPLEEVHLLIVISPAEQDHQVANTLVVALDRYKVRIMEPHPGNPNEYRRLFNARASHAKKIAIIISSEYLKSSQYEIEITLIEQLTLNRGKKILIPILKGVNYKQLPDRLRIGPAARLNANYPSVAEQFYPDVIRMIEENKPLSTEKTSQGIALANGHFLNYQKFTLPGYKGRIEEAWSQGRDMWNCKGDAFLFAKNITIIPVNGEFHAKLGDYDPDISNVTYQNDPSAPVKVEFSKDMPGHSNRNYSCTMSKVEYEGVEYIFSAEIPNTLKTLIEMREHRLNGYDEDPDAIQREIWSFNSQLQSLIVTIDDEHTASRRESIIIVSYDGSESLGSVIASAIRGNMERDKYQPELIEI